MPKVASVPSVEALPTRADVVVVGGGIVGVSAAFFLARKGISTALCEKGVIAGEQSSRNWGWCRMTLRDPAEIPLMRESLSLWREMGRLAGAETGYRTTGLMYLSAGPDDAAKYESWLDKARPFQLESRMLSGREVANLLPGGAREWPGALYSAGDGGAEPELAAPAIAEAAQRLGAAVVTSCAVRGIETEAGRVAAVVTERGRIACPSVLLAGGIWSGIFCRSLGLSLPQLKVTGSVMRTGPLAGAPEVSATGPGFGYRKCADGGYIVSQPGATIFDIVPDSFRYLGAFLPSLKAEWRGLRLRIGSRFVAEARLPRRWALDRPSPFEAMRIMDPKHSREVLDESARNIAAAYPAFRGMTVLERWGGIADVMPDALPVISAVDGLPGFYLATGFSGHGFGIGPGAGRLAADLVTGEASPTALAPFRFSRFGKGGISAGAA
jgi:glycine/D-amino acid oxidase-like deaminating enzyme